VRNVRVIRLACALALLVFVACADPLSSSQVESDGVESGRTDTALVSAGESESTESGTESDTGTDGNTLLGPSDSIGKFDNGRARDHVRVLAGEIGVRVRGTSGERRGIRYVNRYLDQLGYKTDVQEFRVDGGRSHNVVARWPGAGKNIFVIGAHIDTVEQSPGANDNASGTAVMLETARLFANTPQSKWLRFIAFGSEEYGNNDLHHVGSHKYVKRLGEKGRNHVAGMISVDMIADGRPLIIGWAGIGPQRVARTLFRKLERTNIGVDYRQTCDCSDNGPFEIAGIPASFMWSGDEPNYHDPSDTPENLKPKHMLRTGRAVRIFLKQLDWNLMRKFRRS
jgi:Peptidase family M28